MKRLLTLVMAIAALLLVYGCDQNSPTQSAGIDHAAYVLVERPEFVDTRPPAEIEAAVMNVALDYSAVLQKKPVKPPPDTTDPNPNPAHKYAYIVGISNYEGTAYDLNYCDDDARAMKSWLQGEGFTCRMDLDLQATGDNITAGLQWLIDNAVPGDEIAFCYSGHGGKPAGYGSSLISADLYYVTHGYVMSYFNAVDCTKKLATLDACVIGDFHSDVEAGTFMATASTRKSSYDAPDLQHGAWTWYWLDGVEDMNLIFAEKTAPYAEDGMKDWAAQYRLRVDPKHTDDYDGWMDM